MELDRGIAGYGRAPCPFSIVEAVRLHGWTASAPTTCKQVRKLVWPELTFCAFMGAVSGARFPPGFCGRRCVIHGISRKQKMSTGPDPCGSMRIHPESRCRKHRDQRQNMQVYSLTKTIAAPSYAWIPRSRATKNPARIVTLLYSRVTIQLEFSMCPRASSSPPSSYPSLSSSVVGRRSSPPSSSPWWSSSSVVGQVFAYENVSKFEFEPFTR